ncbi:MAG TPA: hypothetical protein VGP99_00475 [Tepidisphaeraceae bacterium]|nr:hypothetical protein [Tepidisphaeraceae bacterium]
MDRSVPSSARRAALILLALSAPPAWAGAALHLAPGVDAGKFLVTPDGSHVVFEHYSTDETALYSVRTDAVGSYLQISPMASSAFLFNSRISPDSSRIVFDANEFPGGGWQVSTYSSRIDGGIGPILLNTSHVYDDDPSQYNIAISPDSQRAILRADQGDYSFDLLGGPIDGSATPTMLNPGPHSGNFGTGVGHDWAAAGNRVVFLIQNGASRTLFSREFDASAPPVELSPSGQPVGIYAVSGNNSTIVMATRPGPAVAYNLYSISVGGANLTPLVTSDDTHTHLFQGLSLSSDGQHAIFMENYQISTIRTDGLGTAVRLDPAVDSEQVRYDISPNSAKIAFLSRHGGDQSELFVSPIDASIPAKKLSLPLPPGGSISDVQFTPDSRHIIYLGDQLNDGVDEIFSVLADGSAPPVRLAPVGQFAITPDSATLITGTNPGDGFTVQSLVAIPIDGGQPVELLHNPFLTGGINQWRLTDDGSMIIFTADNGGISEIFAVAIPEPAGMSVLVACGWMLLAGMRRRRISLQ